jgi:hypothetical protein
MKYRFLAGMVFVAAIDSVLSHVGVSGKAGAVQFSLAVQASV